MSENNQQEIGLFEALEAQLPAYECQGNSKNHESLANHENEECNFEFLVQDMFLDHFFP